MPGPVFRIAASAIGDTRVLDQECERAVAALREKCPEAFLNEPAPHGTVAPPIPLAADRASELYRAAFQEAAGAGTGSVVVWTAGDAELLVFTDSVRAAFRNGFVVVGITVSCDQAGRSEVVVPFGVGSADSPAGLVVATEPAPRGPAIVIDRWGDHLVAVAWSALVGVAASVAAAAGSDVGGERFLPAALTATDDGLTVLPQARHPFDAGPPISLGSRNQMLRLGTTRGGPQPGTPP